MSDYLKRFINTQRILLCKVPVALQQPASVTWRDKPTLLRVRGALSSVPRRGDSLGVSDVELREEVLLESSLFLLLRLEVRWRKDNISSVGSLCSSRWGSCRCLCVRSLEMTCDSGMPNAWGMVSVWGGEEDRRTKSSSCWLWLNWKRLNYSLDKLVLSAYYTLRCAIYHIETTAFILPLGFTVVVFSVQSCAHSFKLTFK